MPGANPEAGALTVENAAQQITGLLGGGDEAKDDDAAEASADQPEPEGQPEGEPSPEADEEHDAQPADDSEAAAEPADIDLTAEGNRKIKVKVNGKTVTMTLAEAAKGVQLEHDYRGKTSEVAEQRKAHDAREAAWTTERQQHAATLRTLYEAFQQNQVGERPSRDLLDPQKPEYDPTKYALLERDYADRVGKYQQSLQQLGQMQAQDNAENQKAQAAQVAAERALLIEAIPEFGDPVKGKKLAADVRGTLRTHFGVTAREMDGMASAKLVRIAHAAHKWVTAGANLKAKQADPKIGPTLKPGVGKPASLVQSEQKKAAMDRHRKSNSIESAAAALAQIR